MYGSSEIHFLDSKSFSSNSPQKISRNYFGEGSDIVNLQNGEKRIFYMTWKER